jgi:FAD/FMN-containing dehydrogenase
MHLIPVGPQLTASKHGFGLSKAPCMVFEHDQVLFNLMRSIEGLFDPNKIVNPGKIAQET